MEVEVQQNDLDDIELGMDSMSLKEDSILLIESMDAKINELSKSNDNLINENILLKERVSKMEELVITLQEEVKVNHMDVMEMMEPVLFHLKTFKPIIDLTMEENMSSFVFNPG